MAHTNEVIKESKAGLAAHIIGALAFLAVGICLLVLDASFIEKLVYSFSVLGIGILFIIFGVYYMIKYFFILMIIGCVIIFKADHISSFIDALVCLIGFIFGAIMLQQSFALFHMQRFTWFISLVLGAATIASSVYLLMENAKFFTGEFITAVYLVAVGGVSLFSLILMALGLNGHKKDSNKIYKRNVEDSPLGSQVDDSIFEEENDGPYVEKVTIEPDEGSDALFEE